MTQTSWPPDSFVLIRVRRPRRITPHQAAAYVRLLRTQAAITPITAHVSGVATHPEDDVVLAAAVSAHADFLVTGDIKLQRLGSYDGVTIVSPRAFLIILEQQRGEQPG